MFFAEAAKTAVNQQSEEVQREVWQTSSNDFLQTNYVNGAKKSMIECLTAAYLHTGTFRSTKVTLFLKSRSLSFICCALTFLG